MRDCRAADCVHQVEVESDLHVILQLRDRIEREKGAGSMPDSCIEDKRGIDNLLQSIVIEVRVPDDPP